ncbi:MAG: hypothetical protein FJ304_22745 [Planctomycetes bacterium]|nr:hypothetical protein [Planctomycetota bacterium]
MRTVLALAALALVARAAPAQTPEQAAQFRAQQHRINGLIAENFRRLDADLAVLKSDLDAGRRSSESTLRRADQMLRTIKELQEQYADLSLRLAAAEARIGALESRVDQLERDNRALREQLGRGPSYPPPAPNPLYYSSRGGAPISSYSTVFGSASAPLYRRP